MVAREKHGAQMDDDIQCSHLEDPVVVIKKEPDDVDTVAENIKLETENMILEENDGEPDRTDNKCTKIERKVLNDNITGTPIRNKPGDTTSLVVHEPESVNKNIVKDKMIAISNIHVTIDKVDATLLHHRDNKVTAHDKQTSEFHKQTSKSNIRLKKKGHRSKTHLESHTSTRDEKQFQCDVCHKYFTRRRNLTRHMYTHTGEKPYMCDVCKQCFARKATLLSHIRSRTGEKPYMCDVCDKCFNVSHTLKRHIRIHTGEKPYVCSVCQKCFREKGTLERHKKSQHRGCL